MKTFLTAAACICLLVGCSGPDARNKWQKQEEFVVRRPVYYNEFVQSGGMGKDDQINHNNPIKKEIQNSLNQGRLLTNLQ